MAHHSQHTPTRDLLAELVAFPTISADSNLALIDFIRAYLDTFGVESHLFHNPEKTKANLFARLGPAPQGPEHAGVILSGHSDVVPVEGQPWSSDPFTLREESGKLYARGSCDMKGFIASCLSRVPNMLNAPLKEPIYLAFSYDEETGCTGVRDMVQHVAELDLRPRACIVGEPTSMGVINAHKGISATQVDIKGASAHSSLPHLGANAIVAAAQLITKLGEMGEAAKTQTDDRFFPPHTTYNVGTIQGGNATNIVAENARFVFEFRAIPGFDGDAFIAELDEFAQSSVVPAMQETAPDASITLTRLTNVPPLMAHAGSDVVTFVMQLARTNEVGCVSYATEAGMFQQDGGVPTVVCGPGSIDQAHKADEYVEISQLDECDAMLDRLIEALS